MAISIKTPEEIQKMRTASQLAVELLEMVELHVKPGITTDELNDICHRYTVDVLGATSAPLNYRGFPKSICTSPNYVVCHGIPNQRRLKNGDILNIDVTLVKDGYHGDTSKMFFIGKPSILAQRLVTVAQECLYLGIEAVKPGARFGDIGFAISKHAHKHGFSVVEEYCGHGIGKEFHEDPQVLHYGEPNTGEILCPGMTFTIEPMINAGKRYTRLLPDGWTVVTRDHSLSAQWEHTVAVTKIGVEVLTKRSEERLGWI